MPLQLPGRGEEGGVKEEKKGRQLDGYRLLLLMTGREEEQRTEERRANKEVEENEAYEDEAKGGGRTFTLPLQAPSTTSYSTIVQYNTQGKISPPRAHCSDNKKQRWVLYSREM